MIYKIGDIIKSKAPNTVPFIIYHISGEDYHYTYYDKSTNGEYIFNQPYITQTSISRLDSRKDEFQIQKRFDVDIFHKFNFEEALEKYILHEEYLLEHKSEECIIDYNDITYV